MRQLFNFICPDCRIVTEKLVDTNLREYDCKCGGKATRMIGMPTVRLEGITGAFPGAHEKWARIREDNARIKAQRSYSGE